MFLLWFLGLECCFPDHLSTCRLEAGAIEVLLVLEICSLRGFLCPEPSQLCSCEPGLRVHVATELWSGSVSVSVEPVVTECPGGLPCQGLLRPGGWVQYHLRWVPRGRAGLHAEQAASEKPVLPELLRMIGNQKVN